MEDVVSKISGDTLEKAMSELFEVPEQRLDKIRELRSKLESWTPNPDDPHEKELTLPAARVADDKFLLRFLRARKFDTDRATKLFVNFHKFRHKYSSLLGDITPASAKEILKLNVVSVLPERTIQGCRMVVMRLGNFNFEEHPFQHLLKTMLVILDHLIQEEETQVHGIKMCHDMSDVTFLQIVNMVRQEPVAKGMMMELVQVRALLVL